MRPPHENAPVLAGTRGAGNIFALNKHPKHSTRRFPSNQARKQKADAPYPSDPRSAALRLIIDTHLEMIHNDAPRVRLFLGPRAVDLAIRWCEVHGAGTAWVLVDGVDPCSIPWPAGALVKVVQSDARPEPLSRLSELANALRHAGVAYAAIDHQEGWPNLWPKDATGSAR